MGWAGPKVDRLTEGGPDLCREVVSGHPLASQSRGRVGPQVAELVRAEGRGSEHEAAILGQAPDSSLTHPQSWGTFLLSAWISPVTVSPASRSPSAASGTCRSFCWTATPCKAHLPR